MTDEKAASREAHFLKHWQAWVVLHHFLPVNLLRELFEVVVRKTTDDKLNLNELFEERLIGDVAGFGTWLIKPLDRTSPEAGQLQNLIRDVVWRNDSGYLYSTDATGEKNSILNFLARLFEVGIWDLGSSENITKRIRGYAFAQNSFNTYLDIFECVRKLRRRGAINQIPGGVCKLLDEIPNPLSGVVAKHVGDLCADIDDWGSAILFYQRAHTAFEDSEVVWEDFVSLMDSVVDHSLANAQSVVFGVDAGARSFNNESTDFSLNGNAFASVNMSHDKWVANAKSADRVFPSDSRVTQLPPPLLLSAHSLSRPLENWVDKSYSDAHRSFWALLRRQIALGGGAHTHETKAYYARSLLDELAGSSRRLEKHSFALAIRLLLESASSRAAESVAWSEYLVDTYVDEECLTLVCDHASAHLGVKRDREAVAIELFREWTAKVSIDRNSLAASMLRYISTMVAGESRRARNEPNIVLKSLEALKSIAEKRPEMRSLVADEMAGAVIEKIRNPEFWDVRESAIEVIHAYADVLSENLLSQAVEVVVSFLEQTRPQSGAWVNVRASFHFLVGRAVKKFSGRTPDIGKRIIFQILRFGLEQDTEYARALFYLHDFDSNLLKDRAIIEKLRPVVSYIKDGALQTNSTASLSNINALLVAPRISGLSGIDMAIEGVTRILRSADSDHPSIVLVAAYEPLLLLSNNFKEISESVGLSREGLSKRLLPLLTLVENFWSLSIERPLLFAPFSFPPASKPDAVGVHNWAFTSIRLADELGRTTEMRQVVLAAAKNRALSGAINLAMTTRVVAGAKEELDVEAINSDDRKSFYSALGSRLSFLRDDSDYARGLCGILLKQCLHLGPREIDAAVFVTARHFGLKISNERDLQDYKRRLDGSRDLRNLLMPLLDLFWVRPE